MLIYITIALIFLLMVAATTYSILKLNEVKSSIAAIQQEAEAERAACLAEVEAAKKEVARLDRFRHIPDIIERANRTNEAIAAKLEKAQRRADQLIEYATKEAAETVARANVAREAARKEVAIETETARKAANSAIATGMEEANTIVDTAKKQAKATSDKAEKILERAVLEAAEVRQAAEKRAEEIGGKAYDALKRKEFYESMAEAMRNVTQGYGDRYMVSGSSILDEWAQDYGFDKVGEKLRLARERVRLMEKNRIAATCDYAEASRRELAINFVLDAFNGKVESILARVKHDNYGKLRREIADAFHLVNFNGKAFRDARITQEFLDARLDELKWAEAVQQLRLREKEEQRAIKERLREEEKARKEYERAIRQAQRDEDVLNKALDKARQEYAAASLEERSIYEAKLQDLAKKLHEAEERNQRAISMAQQTKCGHVYIISNIGSFGENIYKIGLTRRLEPMDRVRELGDASVPFGFDVHAFLYSEDAPALEAALHKQFDLPHESWALGGVQDANRSSYSTGLR